jgi:diketogulonate reductase-like aldo/keto reductase
VDVTIVCDQVLYLPSKDQPELLGDCQRHDIALTAYSPLAGDGVPRRHPRRDRGLL